jgi:CO/xanthine dehydrogenase FAD-binding subunit
LAAIGREGDLLRVGGLATMTELRRSSLLRAACPLIAQAASVVGAIQIQNRATVAGNIVNASPAGDTLPVWLALDAAIELHSVRGVRRLPYARFMAGYRRTAREPDELLTAVLFQRPGSGTVRLLYRKIGTRAAQAISKVVFAGIASLDESGLYRDVRLAFGSMGPTPLRAGAAERFVIAAHPEADLGRRAAELLPQDLCPIDDLRSTADYRMRVARNLVREFVGGHLGEVG